MKVLRKFFSEKFRLKKIGIKSSMRFYFFICFLFFPLFVAYSSPSRPKGPNTSCPKSRSALNPNNPTWSPSAKRAKTPTQNPPRKAQGFWLGKILFAPSMATIISRNVNHLRYVNLCLSRFRRLPIPSPPLADTTPLRTLSLLQSVRD